MPLTRPPRAPSATTLVVGSSLQSFDAAAMRCAVSIAVPDGASIFWSWWNSMISTLSKYGAASSAKRIIRIAPIAKFGAITAFAVGAVEALGEVGELGVAEPGGADDRVHVVLGAPREVLAGRVDHREVDRDLGARRRAARSPSADDLDLGAVHAELAEIDARVQRVDRGDELETGRVEHRLAHGRAHPSRRSEHPDPNRDPRSG